MFEEKDKLKKEVSELQEKLNHIYDNLEDYQLRRLNESFYEETDSYLFTGDARLFMDSPRSKLLNDFIIRYKDKEEHSTEDYGWLEPNGTFHDVNWGEHEEWADAYLSNILSEEKNEKVFLYRAGDMLQNRGWILLHNPAQGLAFPTKSPEKDYTKAQREFLYSYYLERHQEEKANEFWKETEDLEY